MKVIEFTAQDQPARVAEREELEPADGFVRVDLKAAALNRRDLWIRKGLYPGTEFPLVPGSDGAGVLLDNADPQGLKGGDDVIILPSLHWGNDRRHQGADFQILGMPTQGTFAERIAVPAINVYRKPTHLEYAGAAALPLAGLTAYRALFTRGRLMAGEHVLITGIGGGVAQIALRFALAAGATVWVTSSDPAKIEAAVAAGASGGFRYDEDGWAGRALSATRGIDVVIDSAAGPGFAELPELMRPGGRVVFFGGTAGEVPSLGLRLLFAKQVDLCGTMMGSPEEFAEMLRFVGKHRIEPTIDGVFPLEEAEAAFQRMESGAQTGKIVLRIAE